MNDSEYRHLLDLIDDALAALVDARHRPTWVRHRLRRIILQLALLHVSLGQSPAQLQRN